MATENPKRTLKLSPARLKCLPHVMQLNVLTKPVFGVYKRLWSPQCLDQHRTEMTSSLLRAQKSYSLWKFEVTTSAGAIAPALQGDFGWSLPLFLNQAAIPSETQYIRRGAKMGLDDFQLVLWVSETLYSFIPISSRRFFQENMSLASFCVSISLYFFSMSSVLRMMEDTFLPGNFASIHGQMVSWICLNQLLNCWYHLPPQSTGG